MVRRRPRVPRPFPAGTMAGMAVAVLRPPKPVHRYIHRAPAIALRPRPRTDQDDRARPRPHRRRWSTAFPPSRIRSVARRDPASCWICRYRRHRVVAGGRSRSEHQPQRRCPNRPLGPGKRARRATGGTVMTEVFRRSRMERPQIVGATTRSGISGLSRLAGRQAASRQHRCAASRQHRRAASGQHRRAAAGPHSHGRRLHRPPRPAGMVDRRHRAAQQALRLHLTHRPRQNRGVAVQCLLDQRRPHNRPTGCVPWQRADPRRRKSSRP